MTIAMERVLAWKIMPRLMMLVMTWMYIEVLFWFMSLSAGDMTSQATALTATDITGYSTYCHCNWCNDWCICRLAGA